MQHRDIEIADAETVAIFPKAIKVRAVALEVGTGIEQLAECLLHDDDVLADGDLSADLLLQIGRGREVIGVGVGLQMPVDG